MFCYFLNGVVHVHRISWKHYLYASESVWSMWAWSVVSLSSPPCWAGWRRAGWPSRDSSASRPEHRRSPAETSELSRAEPDAGPSPQQRPSASQRSHLRPQTHRMGNMTLYTQSEHLFYMTDSNFIPGLLITWGVFPKSNYGSKFCRYQ